MRCLVCNSEMLLIEAVQADANTLPGFQHHTFLCSPCHDVERRLVFTGGKQLQPRLARIYLPARFQGEALRMLGRER
jgi:hypothetical protein